MKVFVTGCTAPHASMNANEKNPSFAGIINTALIELGCDVTWADPSVKMDKEYLSQFDSILVGVASPTNVISHRIYGALSVINHASELGNLSLFVDTPEPHKLFAGIREVYHNPKSLVKEFYSKKREYGLALEPEHFANIFSGLSKLYVDAWPTTIIPAYPWSNQNNISKYIPNIDNGKLFLVSPDAALLELQQYRSVPVLGDYWCADSLKSNWSQASIKLLTLKVENYRSSKWESNGAVLGRLHDSVGALISTYKDGNPWWLPSLSQALYVGVPAVTDWRHTAYMGKDWSHLPSSIEEMSPGERLELSRSQKESYMEHLPSWHSVKESLGNILLQKTYINN
jgi:hypothetical protein